MSIDTITPSSREDWLNRRITFVGASEAACLLGLHPYMTPYELFMRKTRHIDSERSGPDVREDSIHLPPMERGNFLEEKAIELARMLRPEWKITSNAIPGGRIFADSASRMASTPDAFIIDGELTEATLQIKNIEPSAFQHTWNEDGCITPPLWIAVQAMIDASLAGASRAFVGAMTVGFNVDFHLIEVPIHAGVIKKVMDAVAEFWRCVERDEPPPPDFARDGAVISKLFADSDGGEVDLSNNDRIAVIMQKRDELKAAESAGNDAAKQRKVYDAEIIHTLGNAERGRLADGRVIVAKTIKRAGYAVAPSQYRSIRIRDKS